MSEENKAMVRRMVEGINAGEIEGIVDELFASRAAQRVKRLFTEFYTAFPDWREEISGTGRGGRYGGGALPLLGHAFRGVPGRGPTGKHMEVEEVFFLRVADGKFVQFWALEDSLNRSRQLGLVPSRSSRPKEDGPS